MDTIPLKQSTKKKLSQFLSVAIAFTTTLSLSGFALMFAFTASAQVATLIDGDVVKTADNPDVYIVNMSPHGQYSGWKRLILNPEVFNLYGHLSWSSIKTVNQATLDAYQTSALVKGENDPKVYELRPAGDTGTRHHITSESVFLAKGYMWSQIAQVNNKERDMYVEGAAVTETPIPTPVGTGLTVSLASDTAAGGSVVVDSTTSEKAQAMAPFVKLNFAAGSDGDVTVTTLKLKRLGISADSDLGNVYLYDGNTRLAEMTNISSTYTTFTSAAGLFTVSKGSTKSITVKVDIADGITAGKTIALSVNAASDVVAGSATVSGSFPVSGNMMTTAQVSDLGQLSFPTTMTAPTSVDPGSTGLEVAKLYVKANDQKINVSYLKFTNVGSIAASDLANFKLMDSATQLGATVASLGTDGAIIFDLSASPLAITAGQQKNLSLTADIVSGTSRNFKFTVQRASDVIAMDTNYGVYVKPSGSATTGSFAVQQPSASTEISTGTLTISVDPATPTGNVAADYTDQEFARFNFKAAGEAIKVSSLNVTATVVSTTRGNAGVNQAKLYLDGTQIGSATDLAAVAANTEFTFGNSFIVPAGATKTLVIKGEVKTATSTSYAANDTIKVSLVAGSGGNAQKQTSLGTLNTTAAEGSTLTVQTGALTVAASTGLAAATSANPTAVKGATGVKIASFAITAGSGEAVSMTQIVVQNSATAGLSLGSDFQNLRLMNGTVQIGTTVGSLSTTANNTHTFTPASAITINAGQQYIVDVYADVLTGASNTGSAYVAVLLDSVAATGISTSIDASRASGTDVNGQQVYLATGGSLTIVAGSDTPIAQIRSMGQTGQTLATFKLTTGAAEAVNVTKLLITDTMGGTSTAATGSVTNLKLFNAAGTQIGATVASMAVGATASFDGLTYQIAKDKSETLTLKGDINGYPNAVSGSTHAFSIAGSSTTHVISAGATTGTALTNTNIVVTSAAGTAQRVYRSELTVANAMSNMSGGAGTLQQVGKYTFTNTSAGNYSITVTDLDLDISSTLSAGTGTVQIRKDSPSGTIISEHEFTTAVPTSITTWNTTPVVSFTIDANNGTGSVDLYVLVDTANFTPAAAKTISTSISATGITWSDTTSTGITSLDNAPVYGATVTY